MSEHRDYEQLVFRPVTDDLAEFKDLAAAAKDAGFTHIYISALLGLTDFQGDDAESPWCAWSARLPSVFKHATPPGLEDAFPADFVRKQMDFMKAKHELVAELGLRAAYYGNEPHWLSERVYARHPRWRGARCDNSLRTVGMFFSPNVDHAGVREAYRAAVKEIVSQCPLLDVFSLVAGDSGSGYIWSEWLYVNPNGPSGYEGRDMGKRVVGFLECIRDAAAEAGASDPRVFTMDHYFSREERVL
ncbi:hypothetical protein ACFLSJ_01650, partial [Verrucomicrobiota bacterium]